MLLWFIWFLLNWNHKKYFWGMAVFTTISNLEIIFFPKIFGILLRFSDQNRFMFWSWYVLELHISQPIGHFLPAFYDDLLLYDLRLFKIWKYLKRIDRVISFFIIFFQVVLLLFAQTKLEHWQRMKWQSLTLSCLITEKQRFDKNVYVKNLYRFIIISTPSLHQNLSFLKISFFIKLPF